MGILAVAQALLQVVFEEELLVQAGLGTHIGGDHHIVLSGMGIGLGREFEAGLPCGVAGGGDLFEYPAVVGRVADDSHVGPVLCGAAQHGRTAYVDVLYRILHGHVRLGDGLLERIEVDADHVDVFYAVLLQLLTVAFEVPASEQGSVDLRVKGLHAAVADFRESGYLADVDYFKSCTLQEFHGAAGGDDLPSEFLETGCEFHYAGLVADRKQCSHSITVPSLSVTVPITEAFSP